MFRVECEGCKAPYLVDERRVPVAGLRMRCPKCGASFQVERPAEGTAQQTAPAAAKPAAPAAAKPAPLPAARPIPRPTAVGLGRPAAAAPPGSTARDAPMVPDMPAPATSGEPSGADLPVPAAPKTAAFGKGVAAPKSRVAKSTLDIDLSSLNADVLERAAAAAKPAGTADRTEQQLTMRSAGTAPAAPAAPQPAPDDDEAELPVAAPKPPVIGRFAPTTKVSPGGIPRPATAAARKPAARPPAGTPGAGSTDADLPSRIEVGLPVPAAGLPARFEADLPAPAAGLPAPAAGLPAPAAGLPAPAAGLPAPAAGLPAAAAGLPAGAADIPAPPSFGAGSIPAALGGFVPPAGSGSIPAALGGFAPAAAAGESSDFGDLHLPLLSGDAPGTKPDTHAPSDPQTISGLPPLPSFSSSSVPKAAASGAAGAGLLGDSEFRLDSAPPAAPKAASKAIPAAFTATAAMAADQFSLDSEPPASSPVREAGGGAEFGEVNLPEGGGDVSLGVDAPAERPAAAGEEDDMEFGGLQEEESAEAAIPLGAEGPAPVRRPSSVRPAAAPKITPRAKKIMAAVVVVLVLAGASLEVLTSYGAFGWHLIEDRINRDKYAALVTGTQRKAQGLLAKDTFADTKKAIDIIDAAQASAPRVRVLLPYSAFVGYAAELRFGRNIQIDAHAKQQLGQVRPEEAGRNQELARAAEAAANSKLPRAKQLVEALGRREKNDADVAMLAGEVCLLNKEPDKAHDHFQRALQVDGGTARSVFGVARALWAAGKADAAVAGAKQTLTISPGHVGARVLVARALWANARDDSGAITLLGEVTAPGPVHDSASAVEVVDALTLAGQIHMARYRMSLAEASLGEALKIDPKAASAVVGMGELLYREGRFTDALARFEAGIQADPEGTVAKIGVAKTKIAFDRLQEAKDLLKKLRDARPDDVLPAYWLARAEEALGDKAVAEKLYEQAIKAGKGDEDVVDSYIALAQLMVSQGRAADAEAKLADARKELPDTVRIHKALGEAHLQAVRLEVAQAEFDAALKMDAEDLPARFNLGVTFRRMHRFEDAAAEFDKVSVSDKDYPGLALERGLLYEASNRTEEALAYYQQALAKAPGDLDLMLRVGSAEVMSGHAAQAEDILRKVIAKRVNSADVNHYLGRALLLKGTNLVEALRYLKRAVDLDANRAEYHLYVGWAANEAGQPAVAKEELDKAIDLDKGLADAYWQRGVLLRKQGAVVDAIRNLYKALELRPSRFEAYATLAECLEDQNKTMDAIVAWRKAISVDGKRAEWHYRLGRLMGHGGLLELEQAVSLGEAQTIKPGWLSQAYFELAEAERAGGKRQEAINHYRLFLASAKNDSPYRTDAMRALDSLGVRNEL